MKPYPPDNLDRAKYAKFLYEVAAKRGETSNLVININAEWGAGKTHFTRRLAQTIKEKHPTVYVDAWKQDFSDDPLLAIFSSISDQLSDQSDKFISLVKKTEKKVGVLLKGIAPAHIQGIIKKTTGIDDISEIAKRVTENVIELHKEKSTVIEDIKKDLAEWVRFIEQKDAMEKDLPIFIFIDELDRCRPSYAIELLEVVKHIFNVKGLVFFISTDTGQLQHSIKVVYGQGFDAQHYLGRFFDRRFVLTSPQINEFLMQKTEKNLIDNFTEVTSALTPQPVEIEKFTKSLSNILEGFKVNLRDSLKYYDRLCDIIITEKKHYDPYLLLMLMYLYDKEHELYIKTKNFTEIITKENTFGILSDSSAHCFNNQITFSADLSERMTGVTHFHYYDKEDAHRYNTPNQLKLSEMTISLRDYFISSINISKKKEAIEEFPDSYSYNNRVERIQWTSGAIENTNSINSYLKTCWATRKNNGLDLKLNDYFDLVELSTILN